MILLDDSASKRHTSSPVDNRVRIGVLTTHPIQYYAPWFRHLSSRFDLEVLYAHHQNAAGQAAAGFGVYFDWDQPLLDGYRYRWLRNESARPGLETFGGCDSPELFKLINRSRYDVLLVTGWHRKALIQGIGAAWRNRVPVICRGDSHLGTRRSFIKQRLKWPLYRWLLPRFDAHLFVGRKNREYLRHYGVRDDRLFFAPHFVDVDFFATRSAEAIKSGAVAQFRNRFHIPAAARIALFVGKFIRVKRIVDLVRATLLAVEKQGDLHVVLVGEGPLRLELENLAIAHPDRIHFAGFCNQSEMPTVYASADVLVLPSEETWGLVVNEAMACGIPAIVSDAVGSAPDLIEEERTGWTFPLGDVSALVEHLCGRVCADRQALKEKCELYSIETASEGFEKAIRWLHGRK